MIYGYARVSTKLQATDGNSIEAQILQLKAAGASTIFKDTFTGVKTHRPELVQWPDDIYKNVLTINCNMDKV